MKILPTLLLTAALPLMAGCGEPEPPPRPAAATDATAADAAPPAPSSALGRTVARALDGARAKLATEDIDLGEVSVSRRGGGLSVTSGGSADGGRPAAAIRPDGTLLVDGQPVAADARQRALLLDYRGALEAIANAGMDIGVEGADLGMHAATEALRGVFSGDSAAADARIEAASARIERAARALCDRMPALLEAQTALADAMPAFRPYATMDQSDIDDCYAEDTGATMQARVRDDIREDIRTGIREGVQAGVRGATEAARPARDAQPDAAQEADAAAARDGDPAPR